MAKTQSKVLAVSLCATAIGGLFLAPSASAASDLGGKFMVKATNAQESQFWGLRGWHAPGKGTGGSNGGSGDGSGGTGGDPGSGTGTNPGGGSGGTGGGTGSDGSNPGDLPYTDTPGTTNPALPADYWSSMAYGSGRYLAVSYATLDEETGFGQADQTLSSTDEGKTWSTGSMPRGNWTGLSYGSGKFVAVSQSADGMAASGSKFATSTDGVNWKEHAAAGKSFSSVSYGNGTFVAVGSTEDGLLIQTSTDGENWTEQAAPSEYVMDSSEGIVSVARVQFIDGKFYATTGVGMGGYSGKTRSSALFTSTDGKSWKITEQLPGSTLDWEGPNTVYSRDKVVKIGSTLIQSAISMDGDTGLFRSTNGGDSWSKFTPSGLPNSVTPQFTVGSTVYAYSPEGRGIQIYESKDGGSSWTKTEGGSFAGSTVKNELANASHGNCIVAFPMMSTESFRTCS